MTQSFIHQLDAGTVDLEVVGGKGQSLTYLTGAGFTVPGGFLIGTAAYRQFVEDNSIQVSILALAKPAVKEGRASFEQASGDIRALFEEGELSASLRDSIESAYETLEDLPAVAVRSSANAEDLPGLSFAGQQETFLNVTGTGAVVAAVRHCWASLWTAQAISYRYEMDIPNEGVAMAVVVQRMVSSDVSGVLFTANPATGERSEMIVNASPGLGEAIVSGQVTPDTWILDRSTGEVKEAVVGSKTMRIVADGAQGTRAELVEDVTREAACLDPGQLQDLVTQARHVESAFGGAPQDIEWAFAAGRLWLLQSRPITNLPGPPPVDVTWPPIAGAQLLKRQVAENMPDPLSPLFEDLYLRALFDTQSWPEGWPWEGRLTRNWMKNFVVTTVNGYAYQPIYADNGEQWNAHLQKLDAEQERDPWYVNLRRILAMPDYFLDRLKGGPLHPIYLLARAYRSFKRFPALVKWEKVQLPEYLAAIERWSALDPAVATGQELMMGMRALVHAEAKYWHALRSVIGTAKMTDGAFQYFLEQNAAGEGLISGTFLSGFPSRALDAETAMRAIADAIRSSPLLRDMVILVPASRLLPALRAEPEASAVVTAIDAYLYDYGRQVFNLDFVERPLAEEPIPFLMSLKALVRDGGFDLAVRQEAVAKARRAKWVQALKFFKGRQRLTFLRLYMTARVNYAPREEALFYMGRAWPTFRAWAFELGSRLAESGSIEQPDDVYYLTATELEEALVARASDHAVSGMKQRAKNARALRRLRLRMEQPPAIPPIVDDKSPYSTIRNNDDDCALRGFAVSPGMVTGKASVILSPNDFDQMVPGTILVCPLTTPAWTQLFPHATGLVTDIGSILAHGSIVAREYGIPAVLGVGDATRKIESGQTIVVDGDQGTVTVLSPSEPAVISNPEY